ncbi:PepSY domain-containing protein [Aquabacterium humicola]|uniref:PepSY domain-containing protein n=1 Tax=Aquabacterium humicola TaxID=3237377 RepID=UPI00254374BA|nr:PepSY domain-containing protein [Rubrivivax pictus]
MHLHRLSVPVALLLAAAGALASPPGERDHERDHDRARAAAAAGEVMPLPKLLETVRRTFPGEVLEVELEREHGRWVYELRLLQPDGRLLKLHVDARSGVPLERDDRATRRAPAAPDAGAR